MNPGLKCDLCSQETEIKWTWVTPNSFILGEIRDGDYIAEDEDWAVCDPCHQILQHGTLEDLLERSRRSQTMVILPSHPELEALVEQAFMECQAIIATFWNRPDRFVVAEPGYRLKAPS